MIEWSKCHFIKTIKWNNNLFSFYFTAKINKFIPGQFTIMKLIIDKNSHIKRFYSYINFYKHDILEFYISKIDDGILSNILYNFDNKYDFFVTKKSYGNFTLKDIPNCNTLWMISIGTSIGPFISILRDNKYFYKFKKIKFLHSVKYLKDFIYLSLLNKIFKNVNKKTDLFIFVTKEKINNFFNKRITDILKENNIKCCFKEDIDIYNDHIMICGNNDLIKNIIYIIKKKYIYINNNIEKKLFTYEKYY